MAKISARRRSRKRRNSVRSNNPQQEDGFNVSTPSTPSSQHNNTSALDGSCVVSPAISSNTIGNMTITSYVVASDARERNPEPQAQDGLSQTDASTKIILRTPKKSKKLRRSQRSAARQSLLPTCTESVISGEIIGVRVTSAYHCSGCSFKIPSWEPSCFQVKCPCCKTSWKCVKVQCTCSATITLERRSGENLEVRLDNLLLRSVVRFKQQGYCETQSIENELLQVGRVKVVYNDGVVKSVTKISPSSTSLQDMPDV